MSALHAALTAEDHVTTRFARRTVVPSPHAPGTTLAEEAFGYVQHPPRVWQDISFADTPLRKLVDEYLVYLSGRATPTSPDTIRKYRQSIESFVASITTPSVLASVTPAAGDAWVAGQRARGLAEDTIASRQYAVKVWSNSYVYRHLELTHWDLLARWKRLRPDPKVKERLSDREIDRIRDSFDDGFVGIRNKALLFVYLSTGIRLRAGWRMTADAVDPVSGEFVVIEKGGRSQSKRLSPAALKALRRWLTERRKTVQPGVEAMWTTEAGEAISYDGLSCLFYRLKRASGVERVHCHLLRHTFAQGALEKGAERAQVQDMLGHTSDAMTRRYTASVRKQLATRDMPRFSLV